MRQFSPAFAFWWVLVPNLGAVVMWVIGGPSMAFPMFVSGLLAILVCHSRAVWLRRLGVLACFATSLLMYVAYSFNLDFEKIAASLAYAGELNLGNSPEYVAAALILTMALAAALRFAPHTPRLSEGGQKLMALAAVSLLINADSVATAGTRGTYKMAAPAGTPIDSALFQTRIAPETLKSRNLVVILVESLGQPNNAHDRRLFDRAWGAHRWSARYAVSSGMTAYYGSTTNAELREWCSIWSDYDRFDFANAHCLPGRFREAGFATTAIHAFTGDFFDRQDWYADLGFDTALFKPDLLQQGASACGGVFAGACDVDVPRIIGKRLRASGDRRNLIYWLTLNSHLPVPSDPSLHTQTCHTDDPEWDARLPMLCRSYQIQQNLADAIAAEIMRPDFPEADVLIVGDHMPPFFPRALRSRYDTEHVPWILLRNQAASKRSSPPPSS
ncbi:sulfatase-like hydrolase/transferase [Novosphingobium sp. FGD1]|uniref:Sulfatase-like hydrolase/transferase n=1 Tax=Novosphingobium silvae TaxID=2692619 RepID=A0A7X4GHR4_9SPHN|nr:sulfatase-like hydrolase/transferase [Novosphingobium silvae]MYL98876.1 sulfatase-like hydrolase/transferase [Novosphingobium silvae]